MGDIHIRNVWCDTSGGNNTMIDNYVAWMYREMFEVGRWQEIDKDADDGWTHASNILVSSTDFTVAVANPRVITSATGGFDASHESLMITLFATDDGNRGIYNIQKVLDENSLLIDGRNRLAAWTSDEGSITGRIHKASAGHPLALSSNWFVMQAPVGSGTNLQIHVYTDGYDGISFKAYPKGDYATTAYETASGTHSNRYTGGPARMNAFFPDPASSEWYALLFDYTYLGASRVLVGELTNVAVGDDYPGFVCVGTNWDTLADEASFYMLNELDNPITFYPTFYKAFLNYDENSKKESQVNATKINGGLAKVFRPLVVGDHVEGGSFFRGNVPYSFCNEYYWNNEFGSSWWKMGDHALIPRNGASDVRPLTSYAW